MQNIYKTSERYFDLVTPFNFPSCGCLNVSSRLSTQPNYILNCFDTKQFKIKLGIVGSIYSLNIFFFFLSTSLKKINLYQPEKDLCQRKQQQKSLVYDQKNAASYRRYSKEALTKIFFPNSQIDFHNCCCPLKQILYLFLNKIYYCILLNWISYSGNMKKNKERTNKILQKKMKIQ